MSTGDPVVSSVWFLLLKAVTVIMCVFYLTRQEDVGIFLIRCMMITYSMITSFKDTL